MATNISGAEVIVAEEKDNKTNGHFKAYGFSFTAVAGETTTFDFSLPYDISLLGGTFITREKAAGDTMDYQVAPDTPVGALTADANIGDTVLNVSPTVVAYLDPGYWVSFDGEEMVVASKDLENNTITVASALTADHAAGTLGLMTVKIIEDMCIEKDSRYTLGDTKIGGSHIPANTTMRIKYTNNGASDEAVRPLIEFLY